MVCIPNFGHDDLAVFLLNNYVPYLVVFYLSCPKINMDLLLKALYTNPSLIILLIEY